jgi:hypothetical protein
MSHLIDLRKKQLRQNEAPFDKKPAKSLTEQNVNLVVKPELKSAPPSKEVKQQKTIEWEALSFYYNPQKKYLVLTIITLLFGSTAVFIFQKDVLLAFFLALSSVVLILYSNKKPVALSVKLTEAGITLDDKIFYYKELKSFWIDYTPGSLKELSLEAKKWFVPYMKISIENQNPLEIRTWLINFLPEKEHENSVVDLFSRKIGL